MIIWLAWCIAKNAYLVFDMIVLLSLLAAVRLFKWTFRIGRRYR